MAYDVEKTDAEWREQLSPEEYAVLRQAGTERAFTGEYTDTEDTGIYRAGICQAKPSSPTQVPLRAAGRRPTPADHFDTIEYIEDTRTA